ncbi:UDP-N-acetylglucosamine 2-epimerase [Butyrivibrio sp. VCD2006]|uniref:UDP-N-acetylglucosamine 2-epimerase n=1 Tax=Butyrivibrio sp. VCD2006 TaxID=1280664 RepID=UPI000411CE55|nr:UDP-N-acetylglucosamine 2-epimerase [Butyrivibrio sp. VCD2006]
MKKVAIITSTRAEYGLLEPLIKRLLDDGKVCPKVVVTGAHLLEEFGMTGREIEEDAKQFGFEIDEKIDIHMAGDKPVDISRIMGNALILFGEYFDRKKPDAIVVLGDRYEMLAVCSAALNARIPIIHIHGGETTEGAIDEAVRHSITKMSCLHFTSTEAYRKRVIQLGENPETVFNCGALGVENALNVELMNRAELQESLNAKLMTCEKLDENLIVKQTGIENKNNRQIDLENRYAVGTFHPVTLEDNSARKQVEELIAVIKKHHDITWIFTKAGADAGGREVNKLLVDFAKENDNFYLFDSLGMRRYLSAVKGALFVIGNSSSGLIEVPSFHVPTINIGARQKGRIAGASVINCEPERESIDAAITKALSNDFKAMIAEAENPYEKSGTSKMIADTIEDFLLNNKLNIMKSFYDISF